MIEVKWDFEGPDLGRAAQVAVEGVVRRLQRTLGAAFCSEHGLHPVLRISGKTWDTLEISVQTCCPELMKESSGRIRDLQGSRRKNPASSRRPCINERRLARSDLPPAN